jgi:acetyl-CoA C-acetyltransferase
LAPVRDLMTEASLAAGRDAGSPGLLATVDRVAVPQGTWSLADPARTVARRIGAPNARTIRYEIGVSQQEIVNEALATIARGECDVVLVVGGEARVFARQGGTEREEDATPPDVTINRPPDIVAPIELEAGIVVPPVQQYALIENALAAHEHISSTQQRDDISQLWARFNEVARKNPQAAFDTARSALDIATPGPRNRPLAHPYNVWHASQWTVDQAAALLFCSAERALQLDVPKDRWVFPHVALHSSESITLTARRDLHAWPAMALLGRTAANHIGVPLRDLPIAELYSCFPAAVRVQQRELGLDLGGTPTVTGGMTFAGGPFNNFVLQSTAAVVQRLRPEADQLGLVTTVSGMLSKPGLAVWSCTPPSHARGPLVNDMAEEATAATPQRPVARSASPAGPATVVSFTVTYAVDDPMRPARTAIVADLSNGERTAATCEDEAIARRALAESLIGQTVHIHNTTFAL